MGRVAVIGAWAVMAHESVDISGDEADKQLKTAVVARSSGRLLGVVPLVVTLCAVVAAGWWAMLGVAESQGVAGVDPAVVYGLGVIGAVAVVIQIAVMVVSGRRRRSLYAIGEALRAIESGGVAPGSMTLSDSLGTDAVAWNGLLQRFCESSEAAKFQRATAALSSRGASRSDLDEACDAMPQGLILLDQSMRVRYVNGAATAFLGLEESEIRGAFLREITPDKQVAETLTDWNPGTSGRVMMESQQGSDDSPTVLRWIVRPVRRDDTAAAMVIIDDVTQQRIAETASRSFVTQATHELRTPLTNIRLYIETALDEGEHDPALLKKSLNVINTESRRLERIVSDLLSTAEIEAGCMQIRRDDLRFAELIGEMQQEYEAQATDKGVLLNFDVSPKLPVVQGDRDMLALAVHNLIGNAIKYTQSGGEVSVRAEVDGSKLVLEVADTGIGVSEEDQAKVFEKFYRAQDKRLDGITGSGLGLALAREVVRLHGGDIRLHSELNKGSTFTMTVPGVDEAQVA